MTGQSPKTKSAQSGFLGQIPHRDDQGPGLSHELILISKVTDTSQQIYCCMFFPSNIVFIFSANCMTALEPHLESDPVSGWSYFTITSPQQSFIKCQNLLILLTTPYQKWLEKENSNSLGMTETRSTVWWCVMQRSASVQRTQASPEFFSQSKTNLVGPSTCCIQQSSADGKRLNSSHAMQGSSAVIQSNKLKLLSDIGFFFCWGWLFKNC